MTYWEPMVDWSAWQAFMGAAVVCVIVYAMLFAAKD